MTAFITIKPKILILLVIYLSLFFACNIAFISNATYENEGHQFSILQSATPKYETEKKNLTEEQQKQENAEQGGWLGFFATLPVIAIASYALLGRKTGLIVGAITTPIATGIGYIAGYQGIIKVPIYDIFDMIVDFGNMVLNFILMVIDFMTFGVLDLTKNIPSIPYPFNIITFLLALPAGVVLIIWMAGFILDGIRAIFKVPLTG